MSKSKFIMVTDSFCVNRDELSTIRLIKNVISIKMRNTQFADNIKMQTELQAIGVYNDLMSKLDE